MFLSLFHKKGGTSIARMCFNYRRTFAVERDIRHSVYFENDPASGELDPADVMIPYLHNEVKHEMYAKYMEDQIKYSFENLSKQYKASLSSDIFDEVISRDEAILWKLSGTSEEDRPVSIISAKPAFRIPPIVEAQSTEKPTLGASIAAYNESCNDESWHIKLKDNDAQQMVQIIESHC